jgi:hypothetical protein
MVDRLVGGLDHVDHRAPSRARTGVDASRPERPPRERDVDYEFFCTECLMPERVAGGGAVDRTERVVHKTRSTP